MFNDPVIGLYICRYILANYARCACSISESSYFRSISGSCLSILLSDFVLAFLKRWRLTLRVADEPQRLEKAGAAPYLRCPVVLLRATPEPRREQFICSGKAPCDVGWSFTSAPELRTDFTWPIPRAEIELLLLG